VTLRLDILGTLALTFGMLLVQVKRIHGETSQQPAEGPHSIHWEPPGMWLSGDSSQQVSCSQGPIHPCSAL
jgi:hypothetical protein